MTKRIGDNYRIYSLIIIIIVRILTNVSARTFFNVKSEPPNQCDFTPNFIPWFFAYFHHVSITHCFSMICPPTKVHSHFFLLYCLFSFFLSFNPCPKISNIFSLFCSFDQKTLWIFVFPYLWFIYYLLFLKIQACFIVYLMWRFLGLVKVTYEERKTIIFCVKGFPLC